MSNTITIKHGSKAPTANNLQEYELGYGNNRLYIKVGSTVFPIGGKAYFDKDGTANNTFLGAVYVGNASSTVANAFTHMRKFTGTTNLSGAPVNGAGFGINADTSVSFMHKTYNSSGGNARNEAVLRFYGEVGPTGGYGLQFAKNSTTNNVPAETDYKDVMLAGDGNSKLVNDAGYITSPIVPSSAFSSPEPREGMVTNYTGGYIRMGDVVYVHIIAQIGEVSSWAGHNIFTKLPSPYNDKAESNLGYYHGVLTGAIVTNTDFNSAMIPIRISPSGGLYAPKSPSLSEKTIVIDGCYIAKPEPVATQNLDDEDVPASQSLEEDLTPYISDEP